MKKIILQRTLKGIIFVISFFLLFFLIQPPFSPSFMWDSTPIVNGFYNLENDSIDVLFLGASQTYCGINPEKLSADYQISSYDFVSSAQRLPITYYYLQEALKSQSPKIVMVELCEFYIDDIDEKTVAWSYSPMKLSAEKFSSLYNVFDGNILKASQYSLFPLFLYHSRWNSLTKIDFELQFHKVDVEHVVNGGYFPDDEVKPQTFAYKGESDGKLRSIPKKNDEAIKNIVKLCTTPPRNITVIFYRSPDSTWTRNESKIVKEYMAQNGYTFLDLHDHLDEMGFDPNTDFRNSSHLNNSGANKTTDFMAKYLMENYNIGTK